LLSKGRKKQVTPPAFSRDGHGAVWVRFGVSGYWRAWFLKQSTVFYLHTCFDTESMAVSAAQTAYGMASD
jgi:hypothetical protein